MTETLDVVDRLADLHVQATTERSHYYTASVIRDAIAEIKALRDQVERLRSSVAIRNEVLHAPRRRPPTP
jgi:hypothetical protein